MSRRREKQTRKLLSYVVLGSSAVTLLFLVKKQNPPKFKQATGAIASGVLALNMLDEL